jgi:uncharacterized protein
MKKTLLLVLVIASLIPAAAAVRSDSVELLTVAETNDSREIGGTATMNLQISPGSGDVYIDSFPLTQLDTQISTRFAKEVACEYMDRDCDNVNFYYTIRASSSVVGGPSAGAAAAVLTSALLENKSISDDTVITGTVNSGGYIGPVGGIEAKIEAAENAGFDRIVIPKYSRIRDRVLTEEQPELNDGIRAHTVTSLPEAYEVFTGVQPNRDTTINVSPQYNDVMRGIATQLCQRNDNLLNNVSNDDLTDQVYNQTIDAKQDAQAAIQNESYYSAASYCFGANIDLREAMLNDTSDEERALIKQGVVQDARAYLDEVQDRDIATISDVEASIIVKERLYEVLDPEVQERQSAGYLVERFESARAWSDFFNYTSQDIDLDRDYLRDACLSKLREAEERVRYLDFIIPDVDRYQDDLDETRSVYRDNDYTFCLFKASQLKAEANSIITGRSITDDYQQSFVEDKLRIARQQIAEQNDFFPLLGYSYYTYANSLKEDQPGVAAVFTEYASEFSALDMYFEANNKEAVAFPDDSSPLTCPVPDQPAPDRERQYMILGLGVVIGILLVGITHIVIHLFQEQR